VTKRVVLVFLIIFLGGLSLSDTVAGENFQALIEQGVAACNQGRFDEAIAKFDQAIRLKPEVPAPYVYRGRAKYAKGLNREAIADLNEALKINPNFAQAYNLRAQVYFTLEDFDQALADLQQAQKLGLKVDADYLKLVQKRAAAQGE